MVNGSDHHLPFTTYHLPINRLLLVIRGRRPFTTYHLLFTDLSGPDVRQTLNVVPFLALAFVLRQDSPDALLKRMQEAVRADSQDQVVALFQNKSDADYLLRMAPRCGGIKGLKVAVFPTPKGWEETGKYWAMFHTWQEPEQDHDPIYRVVETPQGLDLGSEIPEWDCGGKVDSIEARVSLAPSDGSAEITAGVHYHQDVPGRSLIFRLNDVFKFSPNTSASSTSSRVMDHGIALAVRTLDESNVPTNVPASFRIGGILVLGDVPGFTRFGYWTRIGSGASYSDDRDQITSDHAYLTSFWLPSLGRLPYLSTVDITAPDDWTVRSEGVGTKVAPDRPGFTIYHYRCDIPISYPKVCAGKYVLALEGQQNGHILRSYQFAPIDAKRAANDVEWMKKAIAFYETNLGPFPFKEYDCFDGKNYYGIESYSYTILAPSITTWAVSHEMGHTYFGGLVPCAYVKDSWNEGMTQYVDDVLLHHNPEVEQNAFAGINVHVPLTQMPVAWEYNGATYWRGAYAMEMLDAEVGHDKVLEALRAMIKDRVGKETTWPDLRQYFEKSSGQDLKWFWDQWISGAEFPHVAISSAIASSKGGKWATNVTVKQSGTASPFRLRFKVRLSDGTAVEVPEGMTQAQQTFEIDTDFQPKKASIDASATALISVDAPVAVTSS